MEYSAHPIENTKRVTATSRLTMRARKRHHNSTLTCQAQNSADPFPKSQSVTLSVKYAPHVELIIENHGKSSVREGDDVTYLCRAHANPSDVNYKWHLDGKLVNNNHGTRLRLDKVGRDLHGSIVTCQVDNEVGKSEITTTVQVACK